MRYTSDQYMELSKRLDERAKKNPAPEKAKKQAAMANAFRRLAAKAAKQGTEFNVMAVTGDKPTPDPAVMKMVRMIAVIGQRGCRLGIRHEHLLGIRHGCNPESRPAGRGSPTGRRAVDGFGPANPIPGEPDHGIESAAPSGRRLRGSFVLLVGTTHYSPAITFSFSFVV